MVTSEVAPFSKSGGLGDVCGALSAALAKAGHQVMVVSPMYKEDSRFLWTEHNVTVFLGNSEHVAGLHLFEKDGVCFVFVRHAMFERAGLYGDDQGAYGDNHIRFALLCRAALYAASHLPVLGKQLGEEVVFHCNDWQAALLPIYMKAVYWPVGHFLKAATVLTLHNPAHQGRLPAQFFADLDLSSRWFSPSSLEFYGDLAILKGGIKHTNLLTTVSPTFARELIQPGGGFGLEYVLNEHLHPVRGILNGIDNDEWNPSSDPHLPHPFDEEDLSGKALNKAELQREMGLTVSEDVVLIGSVGRLDPQKGIELLIDSIPWLVSEGVQIVVLGSAAAAHRRYEDQLSSLEQRYPKNVRAWIGFSEAVAHRIEAACDLFIMPSLFEPCGLNQMYSKRYGTPPVVRTTGGLADSVESCNPTEDLGTGFTFHRPSAHALRDALFRAFHLFRTDRAAFRRLQQRAMADRHSWADAVKHYEEAYQDASSDVLG